MAVLRDGEMGGAPARAARRLVLPVAGMVLLAGCGGTQASGTQRQSSNGGGRPAASTPAASASAATLPSAGTVAATITSLGGLTQRDDTEGIAADGTDVWVYDGETGVLTRIAEKDNRVSATVKLSPGCGAGCGNLALAGGAVWVANDANGTVTRVDASTGKVVATISAGAADAGPQVYAAAGAVWVANYNIDSYQRIDPRSNTVTATLKGHAKPEAVASAAGSLWLCDSGGNPALTRIDPATNAVQASIDLVTPQGSETFCLNAVTLGSSLYVTTDTDSGPQLVDTATGRASQAPPLPATEVVERGIASGAEGGWVADAQSGLYRLDPHTGAATAQLALTGAAGVADDGHAVWVISASGTLYRITPA